MTVGKHGIGDRWVRWRGHAVCGGMFASLITTAPSTFALEAGAGGGTSVAVPPSGPVADSVGPTEVTISWKEKLGGAVKKANDSLVAEITNSTDATVQGRLLLVASGLDGQLAQRPSGTFSVASRAKTTVSVPVSALPIQSEVATSFAVLQVELDRPQGVVRLSTDLLHYIFSGGYARAELYTGDEVRKLPYGGLRASDPADVRGRILDASGAVQQIDARAMAATGEPRQGLSTLTTRSRPAGASPQTSSLNATAAGLTPPDYPYGTATVQICTNWRVQFTDAGFGEDFWATNQWVDVPAAFAWIEVNDGQPGGVNYWWGNIAGNGCSPWLALPAYTWVWLGQWTDWIIDPDARIQFDNWRNGDGQASVASVWLLTPGPDLPPSVITVRPPQNDEAVQTAAISGRALVQNYFMMWGQADVLIPGGPEGGAYARYVVKANVPCPGSGTSCGGWNYYSDLGWLGAIFIAPASPGVEAASKWKFKVGHEIGHAARQNAMGWLARKDDYAAGDDPSKAYCQCGSQIPANERSHCLQSREKMNVAEEEGTAHFFSTELWNRNTEPNATFVYYKPFMGVNGGWSYPPMAMGAYNPIRWMTTYPPCSTPWTDRGVEWDWLTFYWNVTARDRVDFTPLYSLAAIYMYACSGNFYTRCNYQDPTSTQIKAAAAALFGPSSSKYRRCASTMDNFGVAW
jgi:hypothetical protein